MISSVTLPLANSFYWNSQNHSANTDCGPDSLVAGKKKEWKMVFAFENSRANAIPPVSPSGNLIFLQPELKCLLFRGNRSPPPPGSQSSPYIPLSFHFSCSFTMIYLHISLCHWTVGSSKPDSLSGSPSIFISWHGACTWSGPHRAATCCLPSLPLLSWMNSDQHFSKLALVKISGLSIFKIQGLNCQSSSDCSAPCDRRNHSLLLETLHRPLVLPPGSSFLSRATSSQPSWVTPPFLPILSILDCPKPSFPHLHVLLHNLWL